MSKIVLSLLCLSLNAEPYFISELYANAPGRMSNKAKSWMEVFNNGLEPILLKTIELEAHVHLTARL